MPDLGPPISYLVLGRGTAVYDRQGRHIGAVAHVLADTGLDIFHGLIVRTRPLPGRHLFADADQIAELHERGVLLAVDRAELHDPRGPARTGPRETPLQARLRRAWEWVNNHL